MIDVFVKCLSILVKPAEVDAATSRAGLHALMKHVQSSLLCP
ncbi:hypothetical protein HanIR_Chr11g0545301 [Helianthus annuus]|nr:hypothetical protein HanIR_Chr11g0545301 [Helianthus annuus]